MPLIFLSFSLSRVLSVSLGDNDYVPVGMVTCFFVVLLTQSNRGPFHSVFGSSYSVDLRTAGFFFFLNSSQSILFDLFYFGVILFVIVCITCSCLQPFCGYFYFHIYSWTFERMMFKYDLLEYHLSSTFIFS